MKVIIFVALAVVTLGKSLNVTLWDMVPPEFPADNDTNNNLGICFGSNTNWNAYPYVVALRYPSGSACCTGSIISINPGIILTAAHCDICTGAAMIGCSNPLNCNGQAYTVSQRTNHPSWNGNVGNGFDVAVWRTAVPISYSGATALNVPSQEVTDTTVRLTGYGQTQTGSIPTSLQTMTTRSLSQGECNGLLGNIVSVSSTMYCVLGGNPGSENVPTMCSGDSGGPIVSGNSVYGVNSFVIVGGGQGCNSCYCCPGYPQVGANVATLSSWINGQRLQWKKEAALNRTE